MKTAPSFVKTCLILALFQLVSCGFAVAQGTAGDARIAVRVYFTSENDRQQLAQTMSADEHAGGPDYVMVSMTVDEMTRLIQSGRRAERDDVYTAEWFHPAKWLATVSAGPLDLDGVHSFAAIQQFFNQKLAAYPNFTESITIGPSWCKTQPDGCRQFDPLVQTKGSDLRVLKITNKNIPGPKPVLWIDAGIHANELEPPELLMKFVSWLLDGYNIDPDARWLVDSREIHVLLIRNPDGREFVEQLPGPFVYKKADRKTAHPLGCTIWPTHDSTHERLGVDLNRNNPIEWASTIDVPCGETYPGSGPLSEPEARAAHDYLQKIFSSRLPANGEPAPLSTSGTFLNMHSAGSTVFVPWNGKDYCPPNQRDLVNLALHMNAKHYGDAPGTAIQYSGGFVCQPSDPDSRCYPPSSYPATTVDTAYGELGIFASGLEVVPGHLPTPEHPDALDYLWYQNKRSISYLANIADQPYLHARGPDAVMPGSEILVTQGSDVTLSAVLRADWWGVYGFDHIDRHNLYLTNNIAGAEYYVGSAPSNLQERGGTAMLPVLPPFDANVEAVSATLNTRDFESGQMVPVLVRGRGYQTFKEGNKTYLSWGPFSSVFVRTYPAAVPYGTGAGPIVPKHAGDGTAVSCYSIPAPDLYPNPNPRPEGVLRGCQLAVDTDLRVGKVTTRFRANSHVILYPDGAVEAGFPAIQSSYSGQVFYTNGGLVWAGYPTTSLRQLRTALGMMVPPLKPSSLVILSSDGQGKFESGEIEGGTFDGLLPSGSHVVCGGQAPTVLKVFPNGYLKSCQLRTDANLVREDLSTMICTAGNTATFDMFGKVNSCSH